MKKDRLEEKLKSSLGAYPSPMDLESAWSRLEEARAQKKRKGFLFWWLGIASLMIGGLVLFHFLPNTIPTDPAQDMTHHPMGLDSEEKAKYLSKKDASRLDYQAEAKAQLQDLAKSEPTAPPLFAVAPREWLLERPASVTVTRDTHQPGGAIEEDRPARILREYEGQSRILGQLPQLETIISLPQQSFEKSLLNVLPLAAIRANQRSKFTESWWIGLSASLGTHQRSLGVTSGGEAVSEAWLSRRDATEKALESYGFSFDLRKEIGPNWFVQSGIRHQLTYEHFQDQYQRTFDQVLEDQVTHIIQRADGSATEIKEDVIIQVAESVHSSIYNTQNVTEIPLLLGYQRQLNNNLGFEVSLGILYGLIQRKEGQVHAEATGIGEYEYLGQLPYRQSNLWGAHGQGGLFLNLSNRWQAYGGAQFKAYRNLATPDAGFYERQVFFNGVLGLRFCF